jgi:hypothetical protein
VSCVNAPIAAFAYVAEAEFEISVELETKLSVDRCHLTTEPVWPLSVRSFVGKFP